MKFSKTSEQIIRFENYSGHLLIREFKYDDQTLDPIVEFMKTRFFSWKEEFRNEVSVHVHQDRHIVDWNFHGLYDIKKLRPTDFTPLTAVDFVQRFMDVLQIEIGLDANMTEAKESLHQLIDLHSIFYVLRNLPDQYLHPWSVYDFFLSGFKVSKSYNTLIAIECGLD